MKDEKDDVIAPDEDDADWLRTLMREREAKKAAEEERPQEGGRATKDDE